MKTTWFAIVGAMLLAVSAYSTSESATPIDSDAAHAVFGSPNEQKATDARGMVIWRSVSLTQPKYRLYYDTGYAAAQNAATVGIWRVMQAAASRTRDEIIAVGVDMENDIAGQLWQGSSWTEFADNDLASVSEPYWWSQAVAYERLSGDALVVWNNGGTGTKPISSLTWDGSSFSSIDTATVSTGGEAQHMRLAASPNSDEMVLVVSNSTSADYALVWDGSAWGNNVSLDASGSGDNHTDVNVTYEYQSGHAMVTYGNNGTSVYYRIWNGSSWGTEQTLAKPAAAVGNVQWTMLSPDPNSDRIVLGVLTASLHVWVCVWDGSAWGTPEVITTAAVGANHPAVSVAFESLSGDALIACETGMWVFYRTWSIGSGWSANDWVVTTGYTPNTLLLKSDPSSDEVMLCVQDDGHDLNSLLWDGSAWQPRVEIETEIGEVLYQPFDFVWFPEGNQDPILAAIGGKSVTEGAALSFTVTSADAESTPSLSAIPMPIGATFVDNGDGTGDFDWTPTYLQSGTYTLTFTATDDSAANDTEIVEITVTEAGNRPPHIAIFTALMIDEGIPYSKTFTATDVESVPDLTAGTLPSGASFVDNGDGTATFSWTPSFLQAGAYEIWIYATDDSAAVDSSLFSLGVNEAGNRHPVLAAIGARSTTEEIALSFGVSATDIESTPALTTSSLPTGASFVDDGDGTGDFDWTPTLLQSGVYNVAFYATDDSLAVDSEIVVITVTDVGNQLPVLAAIGPKSTTENLALSFGVSATDVESTPTLSTSTLPTGAGFVDNGDGTGDFDWTPTGLQAGAYDVVFYATDDSAAVDSELVVITVNEAALNHIVISPDSVAVCADSTQQFTVTGYDSEGYTTAEGDITWSLTSPLGTIDSTGLFDAVTVGTDKAVATSSLGPVDTSAYLTVEPGALVGVAVTPDSTSLGVGDTVTFFATGYDADGNETAPGAVTWRATGRLGTIDADGLFTAGRPGEGQVIATTNVGGIADTSASLAVDELYCLPIALGDRSVPPGASDVSILTLRIENYFADARSLTGLTIHDASRGAGAAPQLLSNVTTAHLYLDQDADSALSAADSLLISATYAAATVFTFAALPVAGDSSLTLLVAIDVANNPRDGDTVDVYTLPATDITTLDATVLVGPDTANSLGMGRFDGLITSQILLTSTFIDTLRPGDTLYHLLTIDIPRNGYQADTLESFSLTNQGTSSSADIDSLVLYEDDGDLVWGGAGDEIRFGRLVFTGAQWTLSGLTRPLVDASNRFYVAGVPSAYPTAGTTVALAVPVNGIQVQSGNDGPWDGAIPALDTAIIVTSERLTITQFAAPVETLIPGSVSDPLLTLRLVNSYAGAIQMDSLLFDVVMSDPNGATQDQLDSQIDSVLLLADFSPSGNTILADSLVGVGTLSAGRVVMSPDNLSVPGAGGTIGLQLSLAVSAANARNANAVTLRLTDAGDVYASPAAVTEGAFPFVAHPATIDRFPASLVQLNATGDGRFYGGQTGLPALDFTLPGNGYASDRLESLVLTNVGTFADGPAIVTLRLWLDANNNGLTDDNAALGSFVYAAGAWRLNGLTASIPTSGARFIVTADVANVQFDAGALQLRCNPGAIEYVSGVTGPDDTPVTGESHLVFASNRITAISVPAASMSVAPGSPNQSLLTFALYNGYAGQIKTFESLVLKNISHSRSSLSYAGTELGQISLYLDENNDRILDGDPLLISGSFADSTLRFSGLDIPLPAESLSYFFVIGNVSEFSIDSDSLAVAIAAPSDLGFSSTVTINGDMPLTSGGYVIVDGSVSAQYRVHSVSVRTLTPGDDSVPVFAFSLPDNGDLEDTLQSLRLSNVGSAGSADIAALSLWLDANADGQWQSSDSYIQAFTYSGGFWDAQGLTVPLSTPTPRWFVLADIDPAASPNESVQLQIPVGGCVFTSANDGPRDRAVSSDAEFTISLSGLRVSQSVERQTYSVGQAIQVGLVATNLLPTDIDTVMAEMIELSDSSLVRFDSAHFGPVSVPSGDSAEFVFHYTALAPGSLTWRLRAVAPSEPDSSIAVNTATVRLQTTPADVPVAFLNTIPAAVTRGQSNVFPLLITISHPDTAATAAVIRLDSLRLRVLDGSAVPVAANQVFDRLALSTGYATLAVVEDLPGQADVVIPFTIPLLLDPGEEHSLSLLVDVSEAAAPTGFAIQLLESSALPLVDANMLLPVTLSSSISFPCTTEICRLDDPSTTLAVTGLSLLGTQANLGQHDVPVLRLTLRHPGASGSSQIQLTELSMAFYDGEAAPVAVADISERIRLVRQGATLADVTTYTIDSNEVGIPLTSPLTLTAGSLDSIEVLVSVPPVVPCQAFYVEIEDSTSFTVRDLSSGSPVDVMTDTLILTSGSAFPITSNVALLRRAAQAPGLCLTSGTVTSVVAGADSVHLADLEFTYAVDSTFSAVNCRSVSVAVLNDAGVPVDANALFDRIGVRINGGEVVYQSYVEIVAGLVRFDLGATGVTVEHGAQVTVQLLADLEADAPVPGFALAVQTASAVLTVDQTDTASVLIPVIAEGCDTEFPFETAVTRIILAAGRPVIARTDLPAQIVFNGQKGANLLTADLLYDLDQVRGDVTVEGFTGTVMRRTEAGFETVDPALLFDSVFLLVDDQVIVAAATETNTSLSLACGTATVISSGGTYSVALLADIAADAPEGNYVLRFADSTSIILTDRDLGNDVYALLQSGSFPLDGTELSLARPNLAASFTNYPNPFHASVTSGTTIGFVLPDAAHVDIAIYAATGELVKVVADNSPREAGSHQSDIWYGVNDLNLDVVPGTYLCQITARYADGRTEQSRRKVAVVR